MCISAHAGACVHAGVSERLWACSSFQMARWSNCINRFCHPSPHSPYSGYQEVFEGVLQGLEGSNQASEAHSRYSSTTVHIQVHLILFFRHSKISVCGTLLVLLAILFLLVVLLFSTSSFSSPQMILHFLSCLYCFSQRCTLKTV